MGGKLDIVHCDFFKLDPRNYGTVKSPTVTSELLFQNLGIEALPWSKGNFGHLPKQIPYNLPVFSRSLPGLLNRFVYSL